MLKSPVSAVILSVAGAVRKGSRWMRDWGLGFSSIFALHSSQSKTILNKREEFTGTTRRPAPSSPSLHQPHYGTHPQLVAVPLIVQHPQLLPLFHCPSAQ
ncbi:hypothetical protein CIPAW_08G144500 [Carya illinoinensis]|uniref:Uncharacterized protein n=1 Tax=Carya illinoinensis TaxID=32201 RepID=A0A8T1PY91_CARIL|nr:hypothetical protein CIPAW_08G144500 [Carya illinoinensis]